MVVVGSGAGGGVIAKELAEAGLAVVVLDAGPRFDPARYPTDRQDFELLVDETFASPDPARDRYTATAPFLYSRVKGVGGSTLHYEGISARLHESDFVAKTRDGVGEDWPISYQHLEPFYDHVEHELGVSGPSGDDANPFDPPRSRPFPTPPHPFSLASLAVKRATDRIGLHLVREPVAIPTRDWMGRTACIGAGACTYGCRARAKSSIDVTYIPKAEATGRAEIRTECMAREVTLSLDGRARGVVYVDKEGVEHEVLGRAIVIAGNAIETARLLLLSSSSRFPHGLANSSGLVGKYFMEHVAAFASGVLPERVDPWRGIPCGGMLQDFYETTSTNTFARGFSIDVALAIQWPVAVARGIDGWGWQHRERMRATFGRVVGLWSIGEQLPDIRNEVTLDPLVRDSYGLPVPRIANRLRKNDAAMLESIKPILTGILDETGASGVQVSFESGSSAHYLGTCRMGTDPRTSVVDPTCRTHDVPNLFIGDGSVFVTSGAVNPALTISALATRTAAGMLERFSAGEL